MLHSIAIVEDDADQAHNYADALRNKGYRVNIYGNRSDAEIAFKTGLPDLAILDIMLGEDLDGGFEVCRGLLAKKPELPVIFLTSRADEIDRISGLRLGAWDYQTKPVSLQFLTERVGSLFRILALKEQKEQPTQTLDLGSLRIDEQRMQVNWRSEPLVFTFTEFNVLLEIIRKRDERGASYDELAQATRQGIVENNTINTHIRHIRAKFQQLDNSFNCIQNVYGFGYRWTCS